MNVNILRKQIDDVEKRLMEMQGLARLELDPSPTNGETNAHLTGNARMEIRDPDKNKNLHEHWEHVQKVLPAGFSISGNLLRHLSFNQASDWADIEQRDIPAELLKIKEYRNKLILIEYLESLHPEVARASNVILSGDLDMALKAVFSAFEVRIRTVLKIRPDESTMPAIGKAFREGVIKSPVPENTEGVRNFLQGVTGYYRNVILHNTLPQGRNRLEASLSLFALAHEAFILFDKCIDQP